MIGSAVWRQRIIGLVAGALAAVLPGTTETATANGETRTISLYHAHTHESITATFLVDGQYDQGVLDKLNWFLRDWRRDEKTKMDPRLFDVVWEVYRESGSQQPIEVMSAYRSPETNAMLRRRSRQVAEHSQHILGRAMDQHYMDVPMSRIRELGMRLQRGGVGFYPTAGTPFVHLDVGGVRHWPRMSYDQLARLFPDGKTVHIPSNGQPLARYEEARAELESRGDGSYPTATEIKSKGFFAWLFGGGSDEDEDNAQAGGRETRRGTRVASAVPSAPVEVGGYGNAARDGSPRTLFSFFQPASPVVQRPAPQPVAPPPPPPPQLAAVEPAPTQPPLTPMASDDRVAPQAQAEPPVSLPLPTRSDPTLAPFAPLPPRRPTELAAPGPAAPIPPSRPTELASLQPHDAARAAAPGRPDPIGALIGAPGSRMRLPDVITQGGTTSRAGGLALGYAPQPAAAPGRAGVTVPTTGVGIPLPVSRPTVLLSTHLDRSNFRSLTRPDKTDRTPARSALGSVVPPIRAAARAQQGALAPLNSGGPAVFRRTSSDLSSERFSGVVSNPTQKAGRISVD